MKVQDIAMDTMSVRTLYTPDELSYRTQDDICMNIISESEWEYAEELLEQHMDEFEYSPDLEPLFLLHHNGFEWERHIGIYGTFDLATLDNLYGYTRPLNDDLKGIRVTVPCPKHRTTSYYKDEWQEVNGSAHKIVKEAYESAGYTPDNADYFAGIVCHDMVRLAEEFLDWAMDGQRESLREYPESEQLYTWGGEWVCMYDPCEFIGIDEETDPTPEASDYKQAIQCIEYQCKEALKASYEARCLLDCPDLIKRVCLTPSSEIWQVTNEGKSATFDLVDGSICF